MELRSPRRLSPLAQRRRSEAGLTLTELLVVIAVLAVIGGAIAGAFAVGLRTLSPGGAVTRLAGSHDLIAFEQAIGADIARADCLAGGGSHPQTSLPSGGCSHFLAATSSCSLSGQILCIGSYVPGVAACTAVTYFTNSNGDIVRGSFPVGSPGTSQQLSTGPLLVSPTWTAASVPPANTYQWTSTAGVQVQVTQVGTSGQPAVDPATTTFHVVPRAVDPLNPTLSPGGIPC